MEPASRGFSTVDFGSTPGAGVTSVTPTSLTVNVPAGTGTVSVTVTTASGGTSAPLPSAYTYNAAALPTVTAVSPKNGPAAGGTSGHGQRHQLDRRHSRPTSAPPWEPASARSLASSLTVTAPAGTGTVDVTVTTPNGTSATSSADHFTYNAAALPTVTAVSPNNGPAAGGTSVTVSGTNLTGATAVHFGSAVGTGIS